ncbi:hypothetical protein [Haloarcula montana]|uniref:hypothetical protein n=1 Tax=Haloarcula montana TaxID=3111776 RepID=UPI002D777780|nr:hypothetical protein [Haloarcula sp. GH36]
MGIDSETRRYLDECRADFPSTSPDKCVVHGFDGYVDRVRTMVEARSGPSDYDEMDSLKTLENRIGESVDRNNSCSIEWMETAKRAGGHTSHLGRAFAELGFDSTVIGTYGSPPKPIFERELDGCSLTSVGAPSYSDAVEFNDGKFMLNEIGSMETLDWETLCAHVDRAWLAERLESASVLSIGYWSTMPFLPSIWDGLSQEVWPTLSDPPETVFIDTADVRRMSTDRIQNGLDALQRLDDVVRVTISTNRRETEVLASITGENGGDFETTARRARDTLGVSRYFAHTVDRAFVVTDDHVARARTPVVAEPELTASAGDHFNAGAILGDVLELSDTASLILGNIVANWFVRTGSPPSYEELQHFLGKFDTHFE